MPRKKKEPAEPTVYERLNKAKQRCDEATKVAFAAHDERPKDWEKIARLDQEAYDARFALASAEGEVENGEA